MPYRKINFNQLHKADVILTTARDSPISATIGASANLIVVNKHSRLIVMFSLFFFILTAGSCNIIYNSGFVSIPEQTVSDEITIGSEWNEIIPPKPLIPYGSQQWIKLGYTGYNSGDYTDDERKYLFLADGRKTRLEAFLYDDKGKEYELQISGSGSGVILSKKKSEQVQKNISGKEVYNSITDFPKDRKYVKLKIRSEIPLKCDEITWVGYNPK